MGMGVAQKKASSDLDGKLSGLPKGINDRLMTLRRRLSGNKDATIISAYLTIPNEDKDKFYDDFDNVISATPYQAYPSRLHCKRRYRSPDSGRNDRVRGCR